MKTLLKGSDSNLIELLVDNIEINSRAEIRAGILYSSIHIKISQYNLDNLLSQVLEDYGKEYIINKIKEL